MKQLKFFLIFLALFSGVGIVVFAYLYFTKKIDTKKINKVLNKLKNEMEGLKEEGEKVVEEVQKKKDEILKEVDNLQSKIEDRIANEISDFVTTPELDEDDSFENYEKIIKPKAPKLVKINRKRVNLNERQKKIMELITGAKTIDMKDIDKNFKTVTQRTLRRDLEKLEKARLVKQVGKTRNSIYMLSK